jgi:hypothetical protein
MEATSLPDVPNAKPLAQFEQLPYEIIERILTKTRVNDQICVALTSKALCAKVTSNPYLACNSAIKDIRYETSYFEWMSNASSPGASTNSTVVHSLGGHAMRCKRVLSRSLSRRLSASPPPEREADSKGNEVKRPSRRAATEAKARIQKLYKPGRRSGVSPYPRMWICILTDQV